MNRRRVAVLAFLLSVPQPLALAARPRQNPFAAQRTEEHALLQEFVGKWTTKFRLSMPGAPEVTSSGNEVSERIGELWVMSRYDDAGAMGGPFSGVQVLGYDATKKKYVSVWADSQSAELSLQEGTYDAATRTLTLIGPSADPMTGESGTVRFVVHWNDDDHRVHTMFVPGPSGKEMEVFRIEFERAK
jgi:hypothetical protein